MTGPIFVGGSILGKVCIFIITTRLKIILTKFLKSKGIIY
jgi:hypothetical protein